MDVKWLLTLTYATVMLIWAVL